MTAKEWLEYWLARAPMLSEEQVEEILSLMELEQEPPGRGCDQSVS
ncbi:hypothetical protein [Streptomyces sp. NPDC002785]